MTKSSTPKVAAKKAHNKARGARRKNATKVAVEKARDTHRKTSPKVAIGEARDTHREIAAQFEAFRDSQVPATMQVLAESSVAQTREVYERSKNALQAVLESWQRSFSAAGQGAIALNRKIIDVAERNINNGFDLATGLVGAKNIAEVMELQSAYWRKQFSEVTTQAEEVRGLSKKVATDVVRPIK
jgi:phasin